MKKMSINDVRWRYEIYGTLCLYDLDDLMAESLTDRARELINHAKEILSCLNDDDFIKTEWRINNTEVAE